jgi:hypothetical protein
MDSVRKPSVRTLGGTLLATWLLACDGSTPTEETEECRIYPLSFEENGAPFACELDQGANVTLTCASGVQLSSWEYSSLADFVRESDPPNRIRALSRTTTGGVLVGSFTQTLRSYEYDRQGRLLRRTRTTEGNLGASLLDETRYTEWDASGRPTRGEIQSGMESAPVVLTYDDARRLVDTSTGERRSQDANGNLLSEIEVFGVKEAFRSEREYRTTATARVCLP